MKILYVAGREASYSRTRIILRALTDMGHEVITVLPPDRSFSNYPKLLWRTLLAAPRCDVVLTGFYGQLITPVIRLLTWKPIVFDMYITTYDTMVFDRAKAKEGSFMAWLYGLSDRLSYRAANISILDSHHVIEHFKRTFDLDGKKLRRLFLAVDDKAIYPRAATERSSDFLVHFHGEYTPFHGVRHILRAAKLLENEGVKFQIVGKGITYEEDMALARELNLSNVRLIDSVSYDQLGVLMSNADVCLGIFGENTRASLVMTNKVVEGIGMAKPMITQRNAPVQELLQHGESVYLVDAASPQALAEAILVLKNDPELRQRIADNGYRAFKDHCAIQKTGEALQAMFDEVTGKART
jgi:glycosyltransferase involved in cell wall biosynthesis